MRSYVAVSTYDVMQFLKQLQTWNFQIMHAHLNTKRIQQGVCVCV